MPDIRDELYFQQEIEAPSQEYLKKWAEAVEQMPEVEQVPF